MGADVWGEVCCAWTARCCRPSNRVALEFDVSAYIDGEFEHTHVDGSAQAIGELFASDGVGDRKTDLDEVDVEWDIQDGVFAATELLCGGLSAAEVGSADFDAVLKTLECYGEIGVVGEFEAKAKGGGGGEGVDLGRRDAFYGNFGEAWDGDVSCEGKGEIDHAEDRDFDAESHGEIVTNGAFVFEERHQGFDEAFVLDLERNGNRAGGVGGDGDTAISPSLEEGESVDIQLVSDGCEGDADWVGVRQREVKVGAYALEGDIA